MMISDGLGPASVSFARTYYQYINQKPYDHKTPLDSIHVGQSRTRSSSTLVTDSAAGATAFSCGLKTYNGAVGVDPQGRPCGTVLESAKHHRNMLTGLVATSRISHATPASWSSHQKDRDNEASIAAQQIGDNPLGRSVDLMFGGGYCYFLPKSDQQGCRSDERHLFEEAKLNNNWTTEPSLTEMSKKALHILSAGTKESEQGFFLMIEGSRIDMAAHSNDPAAHLHEILEYQNTVALVKEFVDENPDTIMISTSDHETGGLSLARQVSAKYPEYLWYPDVLKDVKKSTAILAREILRTKTEDRQKVIADQLGIQDITTDELKSLAGIKTVKRMDQYLADMVSIRTQLGWATHGHSGVDVNLYAYGKSIDEFRGSHENTDIGHILSQKLDLDIDAITEKLNKGDPSFHLTQITDTIKIEYTDHLDQYHHDDNLLHHPII
ncbi:alkaline-phosphatase-like protein [Chlamydoabsidia padenii]|nr:alkaline-phosphatase-like protein [Chlamydoabsidia padenii]